MSGVDPAVMGVGPIEAIRDVLTRRGLGIDDMNVVEFNEAFASQVLAVSQAVGIDIETQLNPAGGAIALGHPFGMTGIRLLCSLMDNLDDRGGAAGVGHAVCRRRSGHGGLDRAALMGHQVVAV